MPSSCLVGNRTKVSGGSVVSPACYKLLLQLSPSPNPSSCMKPSLAPRTKAGSGLVFGGMDCRDESQKSKNFLSGGKARDQSGKHGFSILIFDGQLWG